MQFDAQIEKTDKGFGIYFAKVTASDDGGDLLTVDGFVEDPESSLNEEQAGVNKEVLSTLQLGDVLIGVNGEDCRGKHVGDILSLLRDAGKGSNTLSFSRNTPIDTVSEDGSNDVRETTGTSTGLMGALRKVKSKIRAEIDGDEEELLREQLEDERFEKQWLEEFEVLKKQYEAKWETCTYTADEFCGILYRSSDAQLQEFLLREYPTLMEAWRDTRASSGSSRVIPGWPAAKLAHSSTADGSAEYTEFDLSTQAESAAPRSIHCSRSLQVILECLREDFMWRSDDLLAFSVCLDRAGITSCSALLEVLDARSGYFERNFQSKEYPRLSKRMLRALRDNAQKALTDKAISMVPCSSSPIDSLTLNVAI